MYDLFLIIQISTSYFSKQTFKYQFLLFFSLLLTLFYPILTKKTTPYIYIIFFLLNNLVLFSQNTEKFQLKITSIQKNEDTYISSVNYKKKFISEEKIKSELENVVGFLKSEGFFSILIDSVQIKDKKHIAFLNLGQQLTKAIIQIPKKTDGTLFNQKIINQKIEINIKQLSTFLEKLSIASEKKGKGFSQFSLTNTRIHKNTLYTKLLVKETTTRKLDSIIVKGYSDFPTTFIKHFYKIKKGSPLNKNLVQSIAQKNNTLTFAKQIKKPEILFSKDSTLLYIYLKKTTKNSFDGMLSFSSDENNKGIRLNGYIDASLMNVFNFGEEININWKKC